EPSNAVNYFGSIAATAVLGKPAAERVKALELYSDLNRMPTSLVYELALNRAEEGNYKGEIDLFRNRFFGSEEGGTNVRQVWVEVKLQQAIGLARSPHCEEALATAKTLVSPVPGLAFTQDGLEPLHNSARTNYLLGETFSPCGHKEEADRRYRLSPKAADASDVVWARASVKSGVARLSVMRRRILSNGPIFETLLRPSLLKSVTTLTSLAERIITLLSCASSTSGVEGPFSRSKPSTAKKRRSAWNSFIMASACGPTKEQETGRNSPPIMIREMPGASASSTAIFKAFV